MKDDQLTGFVDALCLAIAKGRTAFTFEGQRYKTQAARILADQWVRSEEFLPLRHGS